jgi:diaminobutyrate-2-oxoglutarate transaminase
MIGIEIVDPHSGPNQRGVRPPAPQLARIIQQRCYHHGFIVEIGGASDSVVRLLPPLIISDYEIDTVSEILATCFRESLVRSEALQVTEVGIDTAISRTVRS